MKVMMVAVFSDMSTNTWQAKGFENLGFDVVRYNYRVRANKIGRKNRDNEIISVCKDERPDMILFSKCNLVNIKVVRECNKICKTVLWYMDFMPRIDAELKQKMEECNYVFCSRYDGVNEALKLNKNVYRLQGGYDPDEYFPMDLPKRYDSVFIGNIDRRGRRDYVGNVDFDVITGVYGRDHSKIVSESKINLSFSEGDGISNRIYKLLASKGFVLTQPWHKMEEDWEVGKDFDIFNSPSELKEKIIYYLNNSSERNYIAECGYIKVQNYDNNNYARRISDIVLK